jgi:hypothetical protein
MKVKIFAICYLVFLFGLSTWAPALGAGEDYGVTNLDLEKHKAFFDDPRPFLKEDLSYKKVLPPNVYTNLTYDVETMKTLWAEVVGFKAPDVVGKIAPEIKPGTYTYKDKEKYPGFKELMYSTMYNRFNPGAPPLAGNFPEIKVVPTRQYYWALPIAKATKENMGRAKLDEQGYLIRQTYIAGLPFPRPEGKFKAQQVMYNWDRRYFCGENSATIANIKGFSRVFNNDYDGKAVIQILRLSSRVQIEPFGYYDERAKANEEKYGLGMTHMAPRDMYGNSMTIVRYLDPDKVDQALMYITAMRRIRKMSATDTQDAVGGQDVIYDDDAGFGQSLTPKRYPYKFEVLAEREYLVPAPQWDGSLYISSKGLEYRNMEFERRPLYVILLTQMDKNYIYSKRIAYIDKETFLLYDIENYDTKGRLYRQSESRPGFIPEMGLFTTLGSMCRDYVDLHSTLIQHYSFPALWVDRSHIDLRSLVGRIK